MDATRALLNEWMRGALSPGAFDWLQTAQSEIAQGVDHARFCALLSIASRHVPRGALSPGPEALTRAFDLLEGWNPERWTLLESARVSLVLARGHLASPAAVAAIEEAFRYADMGELCALYRSLAHLPDARRFTWRAGEGCRTSMRAVFEAAACDTPFPFTYFDDNAWRQLVIKCLFVEAPLWRVYGLDRRIDAELARMALDLCDERRAAGRPVQHELWLCLGKAAGERGRAALELELAGTNVLGRQAAALALARAGELARLAELCAREREPAVAATMRIALAGHVHSGAFKALDAQERQAPGNAQRTSAREGQR